MLLKGTFASPLLKLRREGGEKKRQVHRQLQSFLRYTQTQKDNIPSRLSNFKINRLAIECESSIIFNRVIIFILLKIKLDQGKHLLEEHCPKQIYFVYIFTYMFIEIMQT